MTLFDAFLLADHGFPSLSLINFQSAAPSKLGQPTPELAAAGALGLLPVHQKLQNCSLHVWLLDVIVYITQGVVDI